MISPPMKPRKNMKNKTPDLGPFFKGIGKDILFILAGRGAISCASLNILQQLESFRYYHTLYPARIRSY